MNQTKIKSALVAICLAFSIAASAQTTVTHTVERGETVASIAKKYNVTPQDIINANPDAAELVFAGMKLEIPAKTAAIKNEVKKAGIEANATSRSNNKEYKEDRVLSSESFQYDNGAGKGSPSTSHAAPVRLKIIAGLTLAQWTGKDFKDGNFSDDNGERKINNKPLYSFHIGAVADYNFTESLYAGMGLIFNRTGYKQDGANNSGKYWNDEGANYEGENKAEMTTNRIEIPLHIGGMYNISDGTCIFLEAGPYLSYAISGESKNKGYFTTHEDIHSGETEYFNKKEKIGKGSLKDYQKFEYGLSATAGLSYNHFLFQFTFQRGLSKLMKKKKMYEQNLMFSIGYKI